MTLSIVFVNWKSTAYLLDCISSIYEYAPSTEFEIIVVDNASPDQDVDRVHQLFPAVRIIKSSKNLGFGGANNLGAEHARGQFLLFLNPDTKLNSPALDRMLACLKAQPDAGIAGCRLLNGDLTLQTSCIQTFPTILNQALDAEVLRNRWPNWRMWGIAPLYRSESEPVPVEVISGACLMIKRSVFEAIGGFSPEYFMYAEDLDLCYKSHRAGYRNYYVGDATVIHYGGGSSAARSATVMKWKSIVQYLVKNRGRSYALLFRMVMTLVAALRIVLISTLYLLRVLRRSREFSESAKWKTILQTLLCPSE